MDEDILMQPLEQAERTEEDWINEIYKKIRTQVITARSKDMLVRSAFNFAVVDRPCPHEELRKYLEAFREYITQLKKDWTDTYAFITKNLEGRISGAGERKEKILKEQHERDHELEMLKTKKEELLAECSRILENLYDLRKDFAEAKKDILSKWMEEVSQEIKNIISLQKLVYNETKEVSLMKYNDRKAALDVQLEQMKKARSYYHERHDIVHEKLLLLGGDGINPFVAYLLLGLGGAAAGVAGYFFSVFTNSSNLSSQDLFYYMLSGFIQVSSSSPMPLWMKFVYLLGVVVGLMLLSWGCHAMYRRLFSKDADQKKERQRFESFAKIKFEGIGGGWGEVKARNWFSYWLQIMPLVVIAGIVIIILSFNTQEVQRTNSLNAATEGLLIGTAIATALSAVVFLYLTKIIEPRWQRQEAQKALGRIKGNWEIAAVLLLFIASTFAIVFVPVNENASDNGAYYTHRATIGISIFEFVSICFFAAFALAYGARYIGLINSAKYIQYKIYRLDLAITYYSAPELPDINIDYSERLQSMVECILGITENKGLLLRRLVEGKRPLVPEKGESGFRKKRLISWFGDEKAIDENPPKDLFEVKEWESAYFPDFAERFVVLTAQYKEKQQSISAIENERMQIHTDLINRKQQKEAELKNIEMSIDKWNGMLANLSMIRIERDISIEDLVLEETRYIHEGLHLATWYRENQLGPVVDYYISCKSDKS